MQKKSKEKKVERINFECSPKFKRLVRRLAKKEELSISAFIRQCVLAAEK